MFCVVIFLICIAGSFAYEPRIVGGSNAKPGQFPYQVSIRYTETGEHLCGGTILDESYILTTAYCISLYRTSEIFIVVGTNTLNSGGEKHTLRSMAYHGSFDSGTMLNDVAVLALATEIKFTPDIQPLPLYNGDIPDGESAVVSGWGLAEYPGNDLPNDLQYAEMNIISTGDCYQKYPSVNLWNKICAFSHPGQGICEGDIGSPLVSNGQVVGLVSWTKPCGVGYPDVFTQVSAYLDWIEESKILL